MMALKEIDKLATRYQVSPLSVVREYCQHNFLASFYNQTESKKILFKGGTALRIIFKSPRFSEDLDFTGINNPSYFEIEAALTNVLSDLDNWGFNIDLREAKKTSGGYLAKIYFILFTYKFFIQIEISFRQSRKKAQSQVSTIKNDYIYTYNIIHEPTEDIVAGKVAALLDRSKPRDWYDLYFLLKNGYLNNRDKERLPEILNKFKKYRGNIGKELKMFLPVNHQLVLKDFKNILIKEINKYL